MGCIACLLIFTRDYIACLLKFTRHYIVCLLIFTMDCSGNVCFMDYCDCWKLCVIMFLIGLGGWIVLFCRGFIIQLDIYGFFASFFISNIDIFISNIDTFISTIATFDTCFWTDYLLNVIVIYLRNSFSWVSIELDDQKYETVYFYEIILLLQFAN